MKPETLSTWEEFKTRVHEQMRARDIAKGRSDSKVSKLLFRGQANIDWHLETTLERYTTQFNGLRDYYSCIHAAKPQIEAYTGRRWDIPTPPAFDEWLGDVIDPGLFGGDMAYEYMVYLRHHGFPSPLLDWSESPYVAAFFAFNQIPESTERVAIYSYVEYTGFGKEGTLGAPRISVRGPYVAAHRRHFLQQCQYTVCIAQENERWIYDSHEKVFAAPQANQDVRWIYSLPASEREKVLRDLDRFNLNAFSLFGSEESLMQTVAMRELTFRE
jgi:hypothetical protein